MLQVISSEKKPMWEEIVATFESVFNTKNYSDEQILSQQFINNLEKISPTSLEILSKKQKLEKGIKDLQLLRREPANFSFADEDLHQEIKAEILLLKQELLAENNYLNPESSEFAEISNHLRQQWIIAKQKQWQLQVKDLEIELANQIRIDYRQTAIEFILEQQRENNSPIWIIAEEILNSNPSQKPNPLRFFFSPPALPTVNFGADEYGMGSFPEMEKLLAKDLRKFLEIYSAKGRYVDFFAGAWTNKKFHSEVASKSIFKGLKTEPTIILESVFEGDNFDLNFTSWGLNGANYRYQTAISLSWRELLFSFVKQRTSQWFAKPNNYGKSAAELRAKYGTKTVKQYQQNLAILQRERQCIAEGEDLTEIERPYNIHQKDYEELGKVLSFCQCILAGLLADEYFLLNVKPQLRLPPLLPEILTDLFPEIPDAEIQDLLKALIAAYDTMYQVLAQQEAAGIPERRLDLAQSLIHLPHPVWSKNQIDASVLSWLQLHGINQLPDIEPLEVLKSAVSIEDTAYVNKLNKCLEMLGYGSQVSVFDACYNRGVYQSQIGNYSAAVYNLNAAIAINSHWTDAYYNRGIAYAEIEKYDEAIADYNKVLQLQPMHALAYNQLGNIYEKLSRYEKAIESYNKALGWGLESAEKKRDLVLASWEKMQQQKHEEERQIQEVETQRGKLFEFDFISVNETGEIVNSERGKARCKTIDLGNGAVLEMVYIPGGMFDMGSPQKEGDNDERPQHTVTIKPFYMGKYAITQEVWKAVAALPEINCALNPEPSVFRGAQRPVENISWYQAVEFCGRLSQKTGNIYRLPTEAEWEYACRAGTTTPFHFGKTITGEMANFDASYNYAKAPVGDYRQQTTPVGMFSPNAFGLYDMHGNVWEWCADFWHPNYEGAPKNGSVWEADGNSTYRLLRGGSWNDLPTYCRSAHRLRTQPGTRFKVYGLRVVAVFGGIN
jgi:formylglycine-generating enzyme required for sulfatase activity